MKKTIPILLIAVLFNTACSDIFEKQLDIYKEATEELENFDEFLALMNGALDTEIAITQVVAKTLDEEKEELKEEYGDSYEHMVDSVKGMRERYYSMVDSLFLGYTYHFVERRTILYNIAADRYCKTEHLEELNGIRDVIKRYSKLSFVDSQRSCDPPARIRDDYEAAKELAENCYEVAKKRILDKEKEESDKE